MAKPTGFKPTGQWFGRLHQGGRFSPEKFTVSRYDLVAGDRELRHHSNADGEPYTFETMDAADAVAERMNCRPRNLGPGFRRNPDRTIRR